jgi:hypothetical protein
MIVTFASLGRYGRLCNQIYQIASTIGIARRNGFDVGFPEWKNYDHRDRFGSGEDIEVQDYFVNPLPRYDGPALPDRFVHWGYHDVNLNHSTSLSGHMQSFQYFTHCFDEVKWYFKMKDEQALNDYVAVHVRLGDYDNAYHPRLTMDYYGQAMAEFPGAKFLVFSDDLDKAREMFGSSVEYADGTYVEDFRLMKQCRHFIIGNSTFSSMAATLGEAPDKRVIAPYPWFGPSASAELQFNRDIYNDDWTVIDYSKQEVCV